MRILLLGSLSVLITSARSTSTTAEIDGSTVSTPSSAVQPAIATACNNYPEFCSRKFSNITEVSAHNSPFTELGNLASNQEYPVTTQLNDGIRQLQAQMHFVDNVPHFCHTSCDLLDAGPITEWLTTVYKWVSTHPNDVVSVILENGDYRPVTDYVSFIESTGLVKYAYVPPQVPMSLSSWPTLETMIQANQRVVLFMDYDANQTAVPWILDEFSQLWETPFDQTNRSFPCNVQRPSGLSTQEAEDRMYMTNHNLNFQIDLLGLDILIPYYTLLDETNGVAGFGSLGQGVSDCVQMWNYPPKFLDVDYYNAGNGSVFEVAAKWNGVTYNRSCCGKTSDGVRRIREQYGRSFILGIFGLVVLFILH
jgi:hypothetical protein